MSFRGNNNKALPQYRIARSSGSVLPFVAFSMAIVVAYVAFSVDITRNILAVRKLEFAADAAGLYAYSQSVDAQGKYDPATAKAKMAASLSATHGNDANAWNIAPAGPQDTAGQWNSGVAVKESDVNFVTNPDDATEILLQVTTRRDGADALKQFFMPAIRAFETIGGAGGSNAATTVEPYRTVEIVGQPACRIGAGAPTSGQVANSMAGFATFPLAISNVQFHQESSATATARDYVIDLVSSQNLSTAALPLHMKACFVNVAPSGDSNPYYGPAQGNPAIDQLISLCRYFSAQATDETPAAVERAAVLSSFDSADQIFVSRKQSLLNALIALQSPPGKCLILPVVETTPTAFPATVKVVGFARMSILKLVNNAGDDFAITLRIEDSVAVPNATCGNNLVSIPAVSGAVLPTAVSPFRNRIYKADTNSLSVRPRGVILAPALSPRNLKAS